MNEKVKELKFTSTERISFTGIKKKNEIFLKNKIINKAQWSRITHRIPQKILFTTTSMNNLKYNEK